MLYMQHAIGFASGLDETMSEKFSRRNLFRLRVRDLAAAWGEASKELKKGAKPKTYVRLVPERLPV